jgi:hypothetical protein
MKIVYARSKTPCIITQAFSSAVPDNNFSNWLWNVLDVTRTETVDNVKAKIRDKEGIPRVDLSHNMVQLEDGRRTLSRNMVRLEDGRTLSDYNIQDNDILLLGFHIRCMTAGGNIATSLYVDVDDTISTIKEIFQYEKDIPSSHQRLILAGQELENERTLFDYNIHHDAVLVLIISMCVDVRPGARCIFCHRARGSGMAGEDHR